MGSALLSDLDETLIVEEPAAVAALEATAHLAASRWEIDGEDYSDLALAEDRVVIGL